MREKVFTSTWGNENLQYQEIHGSEGFGGRGGFGLRFFATVGRPLTDDESIACYKAADIITEAIQRESLRLDPKEQESRAKERAEVLALFPEYFAVQEIENGYCSRYCCSQKPWFRVLTRIGWIKIGWRKSVINIDWNETIQELNGDKLFPNASFTVGSGYKDGRYCHAWGYEKAAEQLAVILLPSGAEPAGKEHK